MFRFTIRDVLWLTVLAAVLVAWWLDRRSLAIRAKETETYRTLSEVLANQLQNKQPAANIEISVNGASARINATFAASEFPSPGPTPATPNPP